MSRTFVFSSTPVFSSASHYKPFLPHGTAFSSSSLNVTSQNSPPFNPNILSPSSTIRPQSHSTQSFVSPIQLNLTNSIHGTRARKPTLSDLQMERDAMRNIHAPKKSQSILVNAYLSTRSRQSREHRNWSMSHHTLNTLNMSNANNNIYKPNYLLSSSYDLSSSLPHSSARSLHSSHSSRPYSHSSNSSSETQCAPSYIYNIYNVNSNTTINNNKSTIHNNSANSNSHSNGLHSSRNTFQTHTIQFIPPLTDRNTRYNNNNNNTLNNIQSTLPNRFHSSTLSLSNSVSLNNNNKEGTNLDYCKSSNHNSLNSIVGKSVTLHAFGGLTIYLALKLCLLLFSCFISFYLLFLMFL